MTAIRRRVFLCTAISGAAACRQPEPVDRQKVVEKAQQAVALRLASPGSAAFGGEADTTVEDLGNNRYRVRGMVDYTGAAGARRVMFTCVLRNHGKDWDLEDLVLE